MTVTSPLAYSPRCYGNVTAINPVDKNAADSNRTLQVSGGPWATSGAAKNIWYLDPAGGQVQCAVQYNSPTFCYVTPPPPPAGEQSLPGVLYTVSSVERQLETLAASDPDWSKTVDAGYQPGAGGGDFLFLRPPRIDRVEPSVLPTAGGIRVTVYGTNFTSQFGGWPKVDTTSVPDLVIIDDFHFTFTAPPRASGQAVLDCYNLAGRDYAPITYADAPPPISTGGVPVGRGRWKLTLHRRAFTSTPWQQTIIAELTDARSRVLDQKWCQPAQLAFTLDGDSSQAPLIEELATEVIAWRWDSDANVDRPMFRGVVDHAEDQLTEQSITTNFVCHDYYAMLARRILTQSYTVTQRDQDDIVSDMIRAASTVNSSSGTSFMPGSYLPIPDVVRLNPDGTTRSAKSGQLRDRTYGGSTVLKQIVDDLAAVINGFDFMVIPLYTDADDLLAVYFDPTADANQGVVRSDVPLMYGATVATLTRTVASTDYANYVRVLGNNGQASPTAPQLFGEAWNSDANNVTVNPVGLWMNPDNASDVSIQSTLDQKAQGDVNFAGLLIPSYSVTLAPGFYRYAAPNMGDTCPLIVSEGRLNVNTQVRVLGITFTIGDDGNEDIGLTLGRPATLLADLFTRADRDVDALTRR